jgi:hypothetical protein
MQTSSWDKMPEDVRAAVIQRQMDNGFSDIDGLHDFIEKQWADYKAHRATTGRISQALKEQYKLAREQALMAKAMLEVLGDDISDTALLNTILFDSKFQEFLSNLTINSSEIEGLTATQKLNALSALGTTASRTARIYPALKSEKRTAQMYAESNKKTTSDEHRKSLLIKMERIIKNEPDFKGEIPPTLANPED